MLNQFHLFRSGTAKRFTRSKWVHLHRPRSLASKTYFSWQTQVGIIMVKPAREMVMLFRLQQ